MVKKANLVYPRLSYRIVGILYDIYDELRFGYREKNYQEDFAQGLRDQKIKYRREKYIPIKYKNKRIGSYFVDFVIEEKIAVELKAAPIIYPKDIKQVLSYLKANNLRLGIIALFSKKGLTFKRIVN